jgi:outer membrane lipoprotein LolB
MTRRWLLAAGAALALVGCTTLPIRQRAPDASLLAAQVAREQALAAQADWTLRGRLGVSDGRDGGSGSLEWRQRGEAFRFQLHAPVTGKTWVLAGAPGHVVLEGLRAAPVEGPDAAALLQRELGWRVPVAELGAWVRGARAAGEARIRFNADGLPAEIEQAGWTVSFPAWDASQKPPLPTKVFARRGDYRVRLAIHEWTLP